MSLTLSLVAEADRIVSRTCSTRCWRFTPCSWIVAAPDRRCVRGDAPAPAVRFLLADDLGAGKTIMAGLLIKEMIARGDLKRCLISEAAILDINRDGHKACIDARTAERAHRPCTRAFSNRRTFPRRSSRRGGTVRGRASRASVRWRERGCWTPPVTVPNQSPCPPSRRALASRPASRDRGGMWLGTTVETAAEIQESEANCSTKRRCSSARTGWCR